MKEYYSVQVLGDRKIEDIKEWVEKNGGTVKIYEDRNLIDEVSILPFHSVKQAKEMLKI